MGEEGKGLQMHRKAESCLDNALLDTASPHAQPSEMDIMQS
jgi:hypothetical protein